LPVRPAASVSKLVQYISATELTMFRHKLDRSYLRTSILPTASCERATIPRFVTILAAMTDTASVISLFFKAYVRLSNRVSSVTRLRAGLSRKLGSIPETDKKFYGLQGVQTGDKTTHCVPTAFYPAQWSDH
jgi:hypothetical protein